jgi:hypothetical protein
MRVLDEVGKAQVVWNVGIRNIVGLKARSVTEKEEG